VLELANGVPHTHGLAPAAASDARPDVLELEAEGDAGAAYALATSYFGTKEFRRCAHTVQRMRSPRTTFLHAYSLFLVCCKDPPSGCSFYGSCPYDTPQAGEETRERDAAERGSVPAQNKELLELDTLLQKSRQRFGRLLSASGEGLLLWLHGVVLRELEQNAAAADLLCQSVAKYPMNWAAWVDLAAVRVHHCSLLLCEIFADRSSAVARE
jgi:anaphase-promoting complex subunit 8